MPGTSFNPRVQGFQFANDFVNKIEVAGITITTRGRCGGMSYAVLDFLRAGLRIPRTSLPGDGDPIGRYLWDRQIQSLIDMGPAFVEKTIAPWESDADRFRWATTTFKGNGELEQFGKLRGFVDRDEPVVLGLISTKTGLDVHHQVVGVGFENFNERPDGVRVRIWDPNHPGQIVTLVPDVANNCFFTTHDGDTRWRTFFVYEKSARVSPPAQMSGGFVLDPSETIDGRIFFLRASDGLGAVARIERPKGTVATTQSLSGFSPAWDLVAGTRHGMLLLYHRASSTAALARMVDGQYAFVRAFPLPGGFGRATAVGNDLVFLLNSTASRAVVAHLASDGTFTIRHDLSGFSPAFTHVVGTPNGGLFLYHAPTGVAATAQISAAGTYQYVESPSGLTIGWTHVAAAGDELLFYRKSDGLLACGRMHGGRFVFTRNLHGHYPGWTHLVGADDGSVMFYGADSGHACTGWLRDGCFMSLRHITGFATGWTHLCDVGVSPA